MKTFNVVVTVHERRDYLVPARSAQKAEEVYANFEDNCEVTTIEETVEHVEELND
tara:strand:+ start:512 stop:676 length:165 start_codon:yes stop_codon:yes gene_type:complete